MKERQDEFQAGSADKKEFSCACPAVTSKATRDGDSVKLESQIMPCDPKEKKTAYLKVRSGKTLMCSITPATYKARLLCRL